MFISYVVIYFNHKIKFPSMSNIGNIIITVWWITWKLWNICNFIATLCCVVFNIAHVDKPENIHTHFLFIHIYNIHICTYSVAIYMYVLCCVYRWAYWLVFFFLLLSDAWLHLFSLRTKSYASSRGSSLHTPFKILAFHFSIKSEITCRMQHHQHRYTPWLILITS